MWPLLNSPFFTADICIILVTARHKELIRRRRVWQIAFEDQENIYSKFAEGSRDAVEKCKGFAIGNQDTK
jgi:hypothetical protein